jgi:Protein of unknown function (DUF1614)
MNAQWYRRHPMPQRPSLRQLTTAINIGGGVIPLALAVYETVGLSSQAGALVAIVAAAGVNIGVCYRLAKPVSGVGIMMPAMVPAAVACAMALMLAPAVATPVAFVAGVAGPLIGADLMHLRDVEQIASGMVSIGGAGVRLLPPRSIAEELIHAWRACRSIRASREAEHFHGQPEGACMLIERRRTISPFGFRTDSHLCDSAATVPAIGIPGFIEHDDQ